MKIKYDPSLSLNELQDEYVLAALDFHEQNITRAAKALKVAAPLIYRVLHRKGLYQSKRDRFLEQLKREAELDMAEAKRMEQKFAPEVLKPEEQILLPIGQANLLIK